VNGIQQHKNKQHSDKRVGKMAALQHALSVHMILCVLIEMSDEIFKSGHKTTIHAHSL